MRNSFNSAYRGICNAKIPDCRVDLFSCRTYRQDKQGTKLVRGTFGVISRSSDVRGIELSGASRLLASLFD